MHDPLLVAPREALRDLQRDHRKRRRRQQRLVASTCARPTAQHSVERGAQQRRNDRKRLHGWQNHIAAAAAPATSITLHRSERRIVVGREPLHLRRGQRRGKRGENRDDMDAPVLGAAVAAIARGVDAR